MLVSTIKKSLLALGLALLMTGNALAAYPEQPINLILPFGAGTASERIFRDLKPFLEKYLGGTLVLNFKDGGGGVVGANYFMTTKPDGYTLLAYSLPHMILQNRYMKTGYTMDKVVPLGGFSWRPDILVVRKDAPYKTLQEFLDYARQNPGKATIGTVGTFSGQHMSHALLTNATGLNMPRVPYSGGGKAMAALLGNQVKAIFTNIQWLSTNPEQLRGLAVAADTRWYEGIPTFKEAGGFDLESYAGSAFLFARRGTPQEVLDKLRDAVSKSLADPELKKVLDKPETGFYAMPWEEMEKRIQTISSQASGLDSIMKK